MHLIFLKTSLNGADVYLGMREEICHKEGGDGEGLVGWGKGNRMILIAKKVTHPPAVCFHPNLGHELRGGGFYKCS